MKEYYKKIFLFGLIYAFVSCSNSYSQILLQSAEGHDLLTSIQKEYKSGLNITVNTAKESITARTYFQGGNSGSPKFHGIELGSSATDGIGTIFNENRFRPGFRVGYTFLKTDLFTDPSGDGNHIDWISFQVLYNKNRFTIFNSEASFSNQVSNEDFNGLSLLFNYTILFSGLNAVSFTTGYERNNNYNSLSKTQIENIRTFEDSESDNQRISRTTQNARIGIYDEFNSLPSRLSYSFLPPEGQGDKIIPGFSAYVTRDFLKKENGSNVGLNIFLTKEEEKTGVRSAVLGFFVEAKDLFNEGNKGNKINDRIIIGITTSFNIFSLK